MKKFLFVISCFLFLSMNGILLAQSQINTSGLTEEQKAQLALQAAQMKKAAEEVPVVEKVNQWVDLGKNVGVALAATAKEIGVAADQFLQSNTGKITVALIVWRVMGRDITGLIVGGGMLLVLVPLWVYFFRRMCVVKTVLIEYPLDKFKKVKHYEYYDEGDCDGTRLAMAVILVIIIAVSLIVIF